MHNKTEQNHRLRLATDAIPVQGDGINTMALRHLTHVFEMVTAFDFDRLV